MVCDAVPVRGGVALSVTLNVTVNVVVRAGGTGPAYVCVATGFVDTVWAPSPQMKVYETICAVPLAVDALPSAWIDVPPVLMSDNDAVGFPRPTASSLGFEVADWPPSPTTV